MGCTAHTAPSNATKDIAVCARLSSTIHLFGSFIAAAGCVHAVPHHSYEVLPFLFHRVCQFVYTTWAVGAYFVKPANISFKKLQPSPTLPIGCAQKGPTATTDITQRKRTRSREREREKNVNTYLINLTMWLNNLYKNKNSAEHTQKHTNTNIQIGKFSAINEWQVRFGGRREVGGRDGTLKLLIVRLRWGGGA